MESNDNKLIADLVGLFIAHSERPEITNGLKQRGEVTPKS